MCWCAHYSACALFLFLLRFVFTLRKSFSECVRTLACHRMCPYSCMSQNVSVLLCVTECVRTLVCHRMCPYSCVSQNVSLLLCVTECVRTLVCQPGCHSDSRLHSEVTGGFFFLGGGGGGECNVTAANTQEEVDTELFVLGTASLA